MVGSQSLWKIGSKRYKILFFQASQNSESVHWKKKESDRCKINDLESKQKRSGRISLLIDMSELIDNRKQWSDFNYKI